MKNNIFRQLVVFIRRKYRVFFQKKFSKTDIELLKDKNFVIVCDNCWAGSVYQWLERPYNSPFISVGFYGDCYLKLLSNFDYYMNLPVIFITESKYNYRKITYPLAKLGDIELHFTHYKTEDEAKTKWDRRTARMLEETNKDNYIFKICDAWYASEKNFKDFHNLPFKNKISFSNNSFKHLNFKNHFQILEKDKNLKNRVPNGVKLFKIMFIYVNLYQWMKNNLAA
ncbi:DUF1919 domain-containing protein [Lutibacter sp.]|uniref:DUF1919 domain-containing protein n=1 Tax=Lutibacter sp. TaxID=1925666 RepID=UPI0027359D26|nr:DUF1919 domain-containing protein [Lutibacter sp.]MDP3312515.1 DUF1919 domain-containing protein [Lutibacter sp.]